MRVQRYAETEPFTTKDGSTVREYLQTSAQSLAEATLAPGQATVRHHHRASEEIYVILEGGGTMDVDGDLRDVGEGDAILIPPGAWHQIAAGARGARLLCLCAPPYSHEDTFFA